MSQLELDNNFAGNPSEELPRHPRSAGSITAICLVATGLVLGIVLRLADMRTGYKVAVAGLLVPAILLDPVVGACALAFSLPLADALQVAQGAFTGSKAVAILLAVSFLPRYISGGAWRSPFKSLSMRYFALYSAWFIVLVPLSINPTYAAVRWGTTLQFPAMVFLISLVPRTLRQFRAICLSAGVSVTLLGMWVCLTGGGGAGNERLDYGGNPNALAHALSIGMFGFLLAWRGSGRMTKILIAGGCVIGFMAILLTESRAALLAFGVACLVVLLVTRGVSPLKKLGFVAGVIIFVAAAWMVLGKLGTTGATVTHRIEQALAGHSSGRTEYIWPICLETFQKNIFLGGGVGWERLVLQDSTHNDALFAMVEEGILGLLLLLWMYVCLLREAMRNRDPWLRLVSIALVAYLFTFGMFHETVRLKPYALAIGLLAAMAKLGICPSRHEAEQLSAEPYPEEPCLR